MDLIEIAQKAALSGPWQGLSKRGYGSALMGGIQAARRDLRADGRLRRQLRFPPHSPIYRAS